MVASGARSLSGPAARRRKDGPRLLETTRQRLMSGIESETAAATAETTGFESPGPRHQRNGDRETNSSPARKRGPAALHGLVPQLPGVSGTTAIDVGESACEPLHDYSYGRTEKINRGRNYQFPPPLSPLWRERSIANKRVIGFGVRFRTF